MHSITLFKLSVVTFSWICAIYALPIGLPNGRENVDLFRRVGPGQPAPSLRPARWSPSNRPKGVRPSSSDETRSSPNLVAEPQQLPTNPIQQSTSTQRDAVAGPSRQRRAAGPPKPPTIRFVTDLSQMPPHGPHPVLDPNWTLESQTAFTKVVDNGEDKWQCNTCNKLYGNSWSTLKTHLNAKHARETNKSFTCRQGKCEQKETKRSTKKSMGDHVKAVHGKKGYRIDDNTNTVEKA